MSLLEFHSSTTVNLGKPLRLKGGQAIPIEMTVGRSADGGSQPSPPSRFLPLPLLVAGSRFFHLVILQPYFFSLLPWLI